MFLTTCFVIGNYRYRRSSIDFSSSFVKASVIGFSLIVIFLTSTSKLRIIRKPSWLTLVFCMSMYTLLDYLLRRRKMCCDCVDCVVVRISTEDINSVLYDVHYRYTETEDISDDLGVEPWRSADDWREDLTVALKIKVVLTASFGRNLWCCNDGNACDKKDRSSKSRFKLKLF